MDSSVKLNLSAFCKQSTKLYRTDLMEKREFRVLIKHCYLMQMNSANAKRWLDKHYGELAPGKSTVHAWYAEYKRGHLRTDDAPRSGRPNGAVNSATIKQVQRIIWADCHARVREMAEQVCISKASTLTILHDYLKVRKFHAQWVPLQLDADQKQQRITDCELALKCYRRNKLEFLQRFITVNHIWINHVAAEKVGSHAGRQTKRRRIQQQLQNHRPHDEADEKVLATVFWDANGIIFIDYLDGGVTQPAIDQFNALLHRLHGTLHEKRPHLKQKKVLFHCDTMPALSSTRTSSTTKIMAKLQELQFEMLAHPANSSDLDPSEFYLFPNLKGWMQGKRFTSRAQLDAEVMDYFNGFDVKYFSKGIEMLEDRWTKCVELNGNYIEE